MKKYILLCTIEQLKDYRNMMISTINIVRTEIDNGKSLEEMKKGEILKEWKEWERGKFTCDYWIEMICRCLKCYTPKPTIETKS